MKTLRFFLLALVPFLTVGSLSAEEQMLKFRLIVRSIDRTALDAPVEGRTVSVS
mgnify:CR=1 FL=1